MVKKPKSVKKTDNIHFGSRTDDTRGNLALKISYNSNKLYFITRCNTIASRQQKNDLICYHTVP